MSTTCRITLWLMPGLLVWGGCATPARLSPAPSREEVADEAVSPSPVLDAEAAMIRQAALESGYSASEALRIEQSVVRAAPEDRELLMQLIYGQLNRHRKTPPPQLAAAAPAHDGAMPRNSAVRAASRARSSQPAGEVVPASHRETVRGDEPPDDMASPNADPPAAPPEALRVLSREDDSVDGRASEAAIASEPSPSGRATRTHIADSPQARPAASRTPPDEPVATTDRRNLPTIAANTAAQLSVAAEGDRMPAAVDSDESTSWQRQLRLAAARLHRELAEDENIDPLDESRLRACLSLLQLVAEDSEQAMESLEGLDDHELEFWRQTIMGLDILMDADEIPRLRHRVENASSHLQSGMAALANLGPLMLENVAFVDEVRSYGAYHEIDKRGFAPGERVLVYVEVSNFAVEQVATADERGLRSSRRRAEQVPQYECDLLGRYEILDADQRVVESRALGVTRDKWRKQRRDFFIAYDFVFPEIPSGDYTFELTIEDRKGNKFGHAAIDFQLR